MFWALKYYFFNSLKAFDEGTLSIVSSLRICCDYKSLKMFNVPVKQQSTKLQ